MPGGCIALPFQPVMDEIFYNLFLEDNLGFAIDSVMWALKSKEDAL
jgi:hypothetical protein